MSSIINVEAIAILDSMANPAIKTVVETENGFKGECSVSMWTKKDRERLDELGDNGPNGYFSNEILKVIENINNEIANELIGIDVLNQASIDQLMIELDGTENKTKFGASAVLSVSVACARAAASELNIPLYRYLGGIMANTIPIPMVNIVDGGKYAYNNIDFEEFMIIPIGFENFVESIRSVSKVFQTLKGVLLSKGYSINLGHKGGFAPNFISNDEPFDLVVEAIERAGYKPLDDIAIGINISAGEFYKDGYYTMGNKNYSTDDMINSYVDLIKRYPIISIEEGLDKTDKEGWLKLTKSLEGLQIIGNAIFEANVDLFEDGGDGAVANAMLIKANKIGTVYEVLNAIKMAQEAGYNYIVSDELYRTTDTFISDLSVGASADMIKAGSVARGESIIKYNRLIEIETDLLLYEKK